MYIVYQYTRSRTEIQDLGIGTLPYLIQDISGPRSRKLSLSLTESEFLTTSRLSSALSVSPQPEPARGRFSIGPDPGN